MIAGIDYSMSCPAICVGNSKNFSECYKFFYSDIKKYNGNLGDRIFGTNPPIHETEIERFENIALWTMAILEKFNVTEVWLEGYSMASKGRVFGIAENTGILKYLIYKNKNIKLDTPSPKTIKKHFSGNGNAGKPEMYEKYLIMGGIDLVSKFDKSPDKSPISDIVDAYAIMCYGFDIQ